jgi:hypothetical protein
MFAFTHVDTYIKVLYIPAEVPVLFPALQHPEPPRADAIDVTSPVWQPSVVIIEGCVNERERNVRLMVGDVEYAAHLCRDPTAIRPLAAGKESKLAVALSRDHETHEYTHTHTPSLTRYKSVQSQRKK